MSQRGGEPKAIPPFFVRWRQQMRTIISFGIATILVLVAVGTWATTNSSSAATFRRQGRPPRTNDECQGSPNSAVRRDLKRASHLLPRGGLFPARLGSSGRRAPGPLIEVDPTRRQPVVPGLHRGRGLLEGSLSTKVSNERWSEVLAQWRNGGANVTSIDPCLNPGAPRQPERR